MAGQSVSGWWSGWVPGLLLLGMMTVAVPNASLAQGDEDAVAEPPGESEFPDLDERRRRLAAFQAPPAEDPALPEPPTPGYFNEETEARYQETMQAYYRYRQRGYEHRLEVFQWQLLTTKITFVVVLILVFAGIYFAAIQFHYGLRRAPGAEGGTEPTEFVFSFKEFKVRSPVLGVIVLTLSLAFFYLYLVYVYPIETIF